MLYVLSCEQHLIHGIDIFGRAYIYFQFQLPPKMYFWMVRACLGMNGNNPGPEWNDVRRAVTVTPLSKMEFCLILFWYGPTRGNLRSLSLAAPALWWEQPGDNLSLQSLRHRNVSIRWHGGHQHTSIQIHRKYIEIVETFRRVSGPNKWWRMITMDYLVIWSLSRFYIFPNDQALAIILRVHNQRIYLHLFFSQKIDIS